MRFRRIQQRTRTARPLLGVFVLLYLSGMLGIAHHFSTAEHHHHGERGWAERTADPCRDEAELPSQHQHLNATDLDSCCRLVHESAPTLPHFISRDKPVQSDLRPALAAGTRALASPDPGAAGAHPDPGSHLSRPGHGSARSSRAPPVLLHA